MKETLRIIAEEFNYLNEKKRKIESKSIKTQEDLENLAAIQELYQHMQEKINNWADEKNSELSKNNTVENNISNDSLRERFEKGKEAINQIKNQSKALQPKIEGAAKSQKDAILERAGFVETNTVDDRKIRIHPSLVGQYHDLVKEQKELTRQLNNEYYQKRDNTHPQTKDDVVSKEEIKQNLEEEISTRITETPSKEKDISEKVNQLDESINQAQNRINNMLEEKGRKKFIKYKGQQYYIPERFDGTFQYFMHELEKLTNEKNALINQNVEESIIQNAAMTSSTTVASDEAQQIIGQENEVTQIPSTENENTQLPSVEEQILTNSNEDKYVQNIFDNIFKTADNLPENNINLDNEVKVSNNVQTPNSWNNIMSTVEKVPADVRTGYFETNGRKVVPEPKKYEEINKFGAEQNTNGMFVPNSDNAIKNGINGNKTSATKSNMDTDELKQYFDLGMSEDELKELMRNADEAQKEVEETLKKADEADNKLINSIIEQSDNSLKSINPLNENNTIEVIKSENEEKEVKSKIKLPNAISNLKDSVVAKTKGFITKVRKPFKNMKKETKVKLGILATTLILIGAKAKSCQDQKYEKELENKAQIESISEDEGIISNLEEEIEKELNKSEQEEITTVAEDNKQDSNTDIEKDATTIEDTTTPESNIEEQNNKETSYVNTIKLAESAKVYTDEFLAYLDEKGDTLYFGNETEKVYLGGLYEDINGNWKYIYIDNPNFQKEVNEIIENGGKTLSVLIAEPSKFYEVYDGKTPLTRKQIHDVATGFIREDGINNENVKTGGMHI